ncbi:MULTISPECIES: hypothetical protein [unclassified Paraburkholderia]|uniref:hypothetical protein n=1 Tax=unclassified Paraburkholderia TaxID=2615204 RepID=UPI0016089EE4|nr:MULTISPECIES: hypothetical protein [unclassified Paraburkholderia]MBB5448138.1 hypothetical protein [Paraburkholderia sp. WSM4177]MBB5488528.1 hypothetical protein [Paraburkholderia sp. WSM4180]
MTTSLFGTAMNVPYPHLAARLFNTQLSRQQFDEIGEQWVGHCRYGQPYLVRQSRAEISACERLRTKNSYQSHYVAAAV